MTIPKSIRNAAISSGILLLLMAVVGTGYNLYLDYYHKPVALALAVAPVVAKSQYQAFVPVAPAANAPEGVAVEMVSAAVAHGINASLTVKTNAGSTCTIAALYNNIASTAAGLKTEVADEYGTISWTWKVDSNAPVGSWPVNVNCALHGRSAFVQAHILVTAN